MKYSLRELRSRLGLRQIDVAERIGVNVATYNAWEALDSEIVAQLADVYQVAPREILIPRG